MTEEFWLKYHARLAARFGADAADEAFARLQHKPSDEQTAPVLWGIADKVSQEQARVEKKQVDLMFDPVLGGHAVPSIETAIFRADFDRAFRKLSREYAESFALTELRGLTTYEAADVLGTSQTTISRRCEQARRILEEELR